MWHLYFLERTLRTVGTETFVGEDSKEGPWDTQEEALDFARLEVGAPCVVIKAPARRATRRKKRK